MVKTGRLFEFLEEIRINNFSANETGFYSLLFRGLKQWAKQFKPPVTYQFRTVFMEGQHKPLDSY